MTRNMGTLDRGLRAFVVAGIMLATAVTGYCPNYSVFGISTDPRLHRVDRGIRHRHA